MAEVRKYFVARGPFRIPTPAIEEGGEVELDSDVAAQFVREGTLNPVGFTCGDDGNPKVDVDPTPDPTPDPVVDPTPDPVVDPTPDPQPDPTPDPTPDPGAPGDSGE